MRLDALHVHQHQSVHAVAEVRVHAKVQKAHAAGLGHLGVLLVQRGHAATHVGQQQLQTHEVRRAVALAVRARVQLGARHKGAAGFGQAGFAVVAAVVVHQQLAGGLGHVARQRDRAEQVAALGVAAHVGAVAEPEVVQRPAPTVARLLEGAAELQPLL